MRILHTTDWHLRATSPAMRTDGFLNDVLTKTRHVFQIAQDEHCDCIAFTGDMFDRPSPSFGVFNAIVDCIRSGYAGPILAIPGQHDQVGYSTSLIDHVGTGFYGVELACRNFGFCLNRLEPRTRHVLAGDADFIRSEGPFGKPGLAMVHAMVVKDPVPWPHILISEVTLPDKLILCGDYHAGFGVVEDKGRVFVNPGALVRLSRTEAARVPQVAIIDMSDDDTVNDVKLAPVPHREDAFDLDTPDVEHERSVSEFAQMLGDLQRDESTPADRLLSGEIVAGVDPAVVEEARRRVQEVSSSGH